jgi:3',5'-cyclic AMP phosphodiesterase CpdA
MTRIAWLTDLHLDFVEPESGIADFCRRVAASPSDVVLVGGDIGTAASLEQYLRQLEAAVRRPIYFVLGNHDFYGGRIVDVRRGAADLSRTARWLHWLPAAGIVELDAETSLVGHDSWADGRFGKGVRSRFLLNDFFCVYDFQGKSHEDWFKAIAALGDEAATYFRDVLPRAFARSRRVVLLTHVPPFAEAAWHCGRMSDEEALPHFACRAVGDALNEIMATRPDRYLTVLCGHTHSPGFVQVQPNLEVHTGAAEYGAPAIQPDVVLT